jgi:hypothetical protein
MSRLADLTASYLEFAHARAERITKLLAKAKFAFAQGRPTEAAKHVSDALGESRSLPVYMHAAAEALKRLFAMKEREPRS